MRSDKFWLFAISLLGWALIKWGVQPESPYLGGMLIASALIGLTICRSAEYLAALLKDRNA